MTTTETPDLAESVHDYHVKMHPDHLGSRPNTIPDELLTFRRMLDDEEHGEVVEAWDAVEALEEETVWADGVREGQAYTEALAHLLHELADRTIVAFGTADYVGVDFDAVLRAVMAANMGKVPPTVPGGKATKPPGWVRADAAILAIVRAADGRTS